MSEESDDEEDHNGFVVHPLEWRSKRYYTAGSGEIGQAAAVEEFKVLTWL